MSQKSKQPGKQSPYKVLYWMGAGVFVLLLGVLALALLNKPQPKVDADPERTLVWIYDGSNRSGATAAAIIEESKSRVTLTAVPFAAPEEARQVFANGNARKTQQHIAEKVGRQIHHRLFLPYDVIGKLIDAAGGVKINGKTMTSADAIAFILEGGDQSAQRATQVMLALPDAIAANGINMGVREGLALAGQVDTDIDLMELPNLFDRWSSYGNPNVARPAADEYAAIQEKLLPDPPQSDNQ